MNWYRVEIIKDKEIVKAWSALSAREEDIIEEIKKEYPKYTQSNGYVYDIVLRYDCH